MKTVIAYIPVLHAGYRDFLLRYRDNSDRLLLLPGEFRNELPGNLERDLRALSPKMIIATIKALGLFSGGLKEITRDDIRFLKADKVSVVMPDETECLHLAANYLEPEQVTFDSAWLRWDRKSAESEKAPSPGRLISHEEFDREMISEAYKLCSRSSDWWRQVGALAVRDGKILISAWNQHQPHNLVPYIKGDPRTNFNWGERIDLSTAAHAEATIIAKAAGSRELSLRDASIYVTTFPCPGCAMYLGLSGIKRVYYAEGYSRVEAEEHLKRAGIEIVKVVV